MNGDFHYYATYAAAFLAGHTHEESLSICASAQLVDLCTRTFITGVNGPRAAATTQSQPELADLPTDSLTRQDITRIWASFHFLPYDLYAIKPRCGKRYRDKFRLICDANGALLAETVRLAKGRGLEAEGLAMHVLADTWAHRYFAGTPSLVINNTNYHFYELADPDQGIPEDRPIRFVHNPLAGDDPAEATYTNTLYQASENSIMNLGHGRAGHLPDLSFLRYRYMPAWGDFREIVKDNPSDYWNAFCQMIYAMKFLRGLAPSFEKNRYERIAVQAHEPRIRKILQTRQLDASEDWKALGESLSGEQIPKLPLEDLRQEYLRAAADKKKDTFLGRFFLAALAQKSMVTERIHRSGNLLAGLSVDYRQKGLRGIRDFFHLVDAFQQEHTDKIPEEAQGGNGV